MTHAGADIWVMTADCIGVLTLNLEHKCFLSFYLGVEHIHTNSSLSVFHHHVLVLLMYPLKLGRQQ